MKTVISHSLEGTQKFANEFLSSLSKKEDEATVVGLYGNLGAGKTTLTQVIARELGIIQPITSPTFVIEKIYEIKHKDFARLINTMRQKRHIVIFNITRFWRRRIL